jgi:Ni/Co efflux regulator RcnB
MTMKKLILIAAMAAMVVPAAADAQQRDRHHDRTNVRQDRTTMRQDRATIRQDRRHVRQDRQGLRGERRNLRQDRRDLRRNIRRSHSAYVAPYRNWSYHPVTVGYRLQPSFYGSRYYISDYGMYNLRAPSRWQQWIRYGNDLLLVNIRTGRVLQVVHYQGW